MNNLRNNFNKITSQPFIVSIFFSLALFVIEFKYFNFGLSRLTKLNSKEFIMPLFANLSLSLVSFALLAVGFYMTLISGKVWKLFFCFICSIAAMVEYSAIKTTRRFTTVHEWNLLFLSSDSQKKDTLSIYFDYYSLVPVLCLILFICLFSHPKNIKKLNYFKILFLLSTVCFYSFTYYYTSNQYYITSISAFFRSGIAYPNYLRSIYKLERTPRLPLSYADTIKKKNNDIIFIVDESVRGDHTNFYGYDRELTEPLLLNMKKTGALLNWKECVSGSTASNTSCLLLLTGLVNDDLPDKEMKTLTMPTLFQYAKAMNYKTHYLDGQMNVYWNGKQKDLNSIDQWLGMDFFNTHGRMVIDSMIALKIRQILQDTSSTHFIWVNKMGVHYAYESNYPKELEKWQPIGGYQMPSGDVYKDSINRQYLINNYDNALLFNYHIFWHTLLQEQRIKNGTATIVYTSDHGQTLGDNGAFWSHNLNTKKEASVPLWIINKPIKYSIDTNFMPHHSNIFPTLLDLMAFPSQKRPYPYNQSLFTAKSKDNKPRKSWYGQLNIRTLSSNNIPFD